jgi:hypothetical protein
MNNPGLMNYIKYAKRRRYSYPSDKKLVKVFNKLLLHGVCRREYNSEQSFFSHLVILFL